MQHLSELWQHGLFAGVAGVAIGIGVIGAAGFFSAKNKIQEVIEARRELKADELVIQGDDLSHCNKGFILNGVAWHIGHKDAIPNETLIEYVKKGETTSKWTEMITSRYSGGVASEVLSGRPGGIQILLANIKAMLEQRNNGSWLKVLHLHDNEYLVEFYEAPSPGRPTPVINLNRAILTPKGLHFFYYSTKAVDEFVGELRQTWIETLMALTLRSPKQSSNGRTDSEEVHESIADLC